MACSAAPSTLNLQIGFEKSHRSKLLGFLYSVFIVFVFASPVYGRTDGEHVLHLKCHIRLGCS